MSVWPFIACHTCLKPVKAVGAVRLDLGGLPHHDACLAIRGLPLVARPRTRFARETLTPLRASEPSVRAETAAASRPHSSLSDSPAGAAPAGAFSGDGKRPRGGASARSASTGSAGGRR